MDSGAGDVERATYGGAVHQNREEYDVGSAHQTPGRTPPDRVHSGHVPGLSTGVCPHRHH